MKAEQIVVGGTYLIRHHGEVGLTEVRVDAIEQKETYVGFSRYSSQPQYRALTRYRCTKLSTGRTITVKSATKFRTTANALRTWEPKS
jgi:hypothetical protein